MVDEWEEAKQKSEVFRNNLFSTLYIEEATKIFGKGSIYKNLDEPSAVSLWLAIAVINRRLNGLEQQMSGIVNLFERVRKLEENQVLVDTLTKREQQVLERLKNKKPTKDIAQEIGVSPARVSTIKLQLKRKGLIV